MRSIILLHKNNFQFARKKSLAESSNNQPVATEKNVPARGRWLHIRRFLVFQVKLYVDALRDFVLSFLSIPAFILDLIEGKEGKNSHMENILALGRRTEKAINLFEQHTPEEQEGANVDSIIDHVERKVRREAGNFKNDRHKP